MKALRILLATAACTALTVSIAFANPGMLPKHPGYPAKGKSPATGQSTANDPGQRHMNQASGATADASAMNDVSDPNRARILKSTGAGTLPQVEGPLNNVNVNPAGATSTKMQ